MPENYGAADNQNLARTERVTACADFHYECTNLMHSVEAGLVLQAKSKLSPEATAWAIEEFADLKPQSAMLTACAAFEQDEHQFDPSYEINTDDPELIRADIEALMTEQVRIARNHITTGQIDDGVPAKVPVKAGEESRLLTDEEGLESSQIELEAQRASLVTERATDKTTDDTEKAKTAELRQLQVSFNQLRADGMGTIEALRQVISQAENSETKQHFNTLLGRVALLQTALPDKPDVVNRLLNTVGLNLAAATVAGSFADFMSAAETDEALTERDRTTLRQIITTDERYARTGSHVQTELGQTRIDDNGQTVPAHPKDEPFQFREYVAGFAEPDGSQKIRATTRHGERVTLDITGWSGADIGRASKLLQLWAMTENEGQTGYLTSITKLNWSGNAQIDPITLRQSTQIVSAVLGHGEGHDDDIVDGRDSLDLIRWQAQLANLTGGMLRGVRDAERTNDALAGLGIRDEDGNLDLDILRAFGDYSRDHWHTTPNYENVRAYLAELFPRTLGVHS